MPIDEKFAQKVFDDLLLAARLSRATYTDVEGQ